MQCGFRTVLMNESNVRLRRKLSSLKTMFVCFEMSWDKFEEWKGQMTCGDFHLPMLDANILHR